MAYEGRAEVVKWTEQLLLQVRKGGAERRSVEESIVDNGHTIERDRQCAQSNVSKIWVINGAKSAEAAGRLGSQQSE